MTRIRATCPACGEVDLRPYDIRLSVEHDVFGDVAAGSCYRFACPTCSDEVVKPADERIARLLRTGGVTVDGPTTVAQTVTQTVAHPEDPPAGPRLTADNLLALHQLLESGTWFSELESMVR